MPHDSYHHGNLRAVLLENAAQLVARDGPERVSLRGLAVSAGVSHAAPTHHFGDRRGLFTALATEGFAMLAVALESEAQSFREQAVAYVSFALEHSGHYAIMFDRSLVDSGDLALSESMAKASAMLAAGARSLRESSGKRDQDVVELAAFSLVHGFATLWINRSLSERFRNQEPLDLANSIARMLFESDG